MSPAAIGVVGVGSLGFHHARILRDLPDANLVGFFDIDRELSASVEVELGVKSYSSLDSLFSDVQAVTIVVPTGGHHRIALEALDSGLDLFIEKPITSTLEQADDLIAVAEREARIIQVGHVERFNGAVRACEPYLEDPLFIESHRLAPFARRGTDVAVVLDLMIHDIDLILSLVKQAVVDVRAVGVPVITESVDIANARLEFQGGAVANITASRVSVQRQRKIRFFQPSGYISLDLGRGSGEFYRRKAAGVSSHDEPNLSDFVEHIHLKGDDVEPLRLELESFLHTLTGEAPLAVSGEEGRDALAVALEIVDRIERHHDHVFDSN